MSKKKEPEYEMLNENEVSQMLKLLNIDYNSVIEAITDTKSQGLCPVAVGIPHPKILLNGIPIFFETESLEVAVYHEDKSLMN